MEITSMNSIADQLRHWFEYEKDANAKVLASLESVPPAERSSPSFQKAVNLAAHLAIARSIWLHRLGIGEQPRELFPQTVAQADLAPSFHAMERAWTEYLKPLTDADLARVFDYQSLDGGRFCNTVAEVLTQLYGHFHYHRGQIASLVKTGGGEPAKTDFIFWTRETLLAEK
jgi:uncharacterized damage-inducible protein DinB